MTEELWICDDQLTVVCAMSRCKPHKDRDLPSLPRAVAKMCHAQF